MGKTMQFIGGIPTTVLSAIVHYSASVTVNTDIGTPGTGYDSTHKIFTLPNSETYDGTTDELKVYINGVKAVEGIDFAYGAGTAETTITTTEAIPNGAVVEFEKASS